MYVGSKDYVLSLDLHDINREPLIIHWAASPQRIEECVLSGKDGNGECGNFVRLIQPWNRTHLYVCGTGAYNPMCTYVNRGRRAQATPWTQMQVVRGRGSRATDGALRPTPTAPRQDYIFYLEPERLESGKGKCPYDPKLDTASALINEELYAGVYIDFMGTDAAIFRTLGKQTAMRTDHPKDYPDEVINFMRSHPLMYQPVYPLQRRPLVVRTGAPYRLTTVAVDQVDAADGRYEVLFLGTDRGTVQKVIVLPKDDQEMEELMLEEVQVFKDPAPVKTMTISSKRQQLYVASAVGVTHLSLHRCQAYGAACADCCLARDPYCAWDGQACSRYTASSKRRSRRQDVRHGN
ncbi:PREDICTED: semaphorin-3F, partial [Myotis davidii]|uniref:semaphorin-3F n=1 Tax=Myotis davidii TaxID=225400 RepID=UPI0007673082